MPKSNWLLVGGETLLGKEIQDLLAERHLPVTLTLASAELESRVITSDDDDLAVIAPLDDAAVRSASVILLGASSEVNRQAVALASALAHRPALVDLYGDFENLPESCVRAPILEAEGSRFEHGALHVMAHPAAVALGRLLTLIHAAHPVRRSLVTIFEPASQLGREGIGELHQQTISLFAFKPLPKRMFDAQVSFNLLPRYGDEAKSSLAASERRIESHLVSLLGAGCVPLPSIRLVHAPVFHGYCQSAWIEFESRPSEETLLALLSGAGVDARGFDTEPASNVAIVGQSGIAVSDIREDHSDARAAWLWLASDNLRTTAENAVMTAGLLDLEENR
ncbi:MAG: hypothetical protein HY858_10620 [Candidatus Solibacter usitatus]|nr:hypothetical protein [Candidatus Solibacter usitatus]